jgi:hypothetical protein
MVKLRSRAGCGAGGLRSASARSLKSSEFTLFPNGCQKLVKDIFMARHPFFVYIENALSAC